MPRIARSPFAWFAIGLAVLSVALLSVGPAQDLIDKMNERMETADGEGDNAGEAAGPDPVALLKESVAFTAGQPNVTLDLTYDLTITQGDKTDEAQSTYRVLLAEGGRFAVAPTNGTVGPRVHADGDKMVVIPPGRGRDTLAYRISHGIAAFAGSRPARWIGHGLGGFTLSLLSPVASEGLLDSVAEPAYLGTETISVEGEQAECHHGRVTTGQLTWDFWVATGDRPLLRRIKPDLSDEEPVNVEADEEDTARPQTNLTIDFAEWDLTSTGPEGAFATEDRPHTMLGQELPSVDLPLLTEGEQSLDELIGKKVIVLDFWATWCPACILGLPTLDSVVREYADRGVVAFAVNVGEGPDVIKEFLAERNLTIPVVLDEKADIANRLKVGNGLPTSFVIGLDGRVQIAHMGVPDDQDKYRARLSEEFDALLERKDLATESIGRWQAMADAFGEAN